MVNHVSITRTVGKWFSLIVLLLLLFIMLIPIGMVAINSFKTEAEYYANGPFGMPEGFNLDNLVEMWERMEFTIKLINSAIISSSVALLAIGLSLLNAFALGIGKIKGRTFFLVFFIIAITLPQEVLAYPLYYTYKLLGIYDTRLAVIITFMVLHSAFGTYLLSAVFNTFPKELIDAAWIDGCNKLQLLFEVVVPLSMPSLSVLFVFFFIWTWNEFFLPLIFLVSNANQTVPLAIALARTEHGTVITTQSAASLLSILPCIIFFMIFQRTLTRGITMGSIK